ncbi:MAG: aminotransferase class I/II-fold pyridoxal phosphate-dependent enzyme [Saprospiraceae bacterium]|jgi:methionine-gamma-lyase|nr:aminotransferase class I/II-fold pyridoxal phosphate-dependent enzyme [Saprospiraceae bacterium]
MKNTKGFGTTCVHDLHDFRTTRPHQLPIYATSSFEFDSLDQGISIFQGQEQGHIYGRFGNPTIDMVAAKLGQLEAHGTGMEVFSLLTSSGMSAISTLGLALLKKGDKILTQGNLYGGTTELFTRIFGNMGVELILVNLQDIDQVRDQLSKDPHIKMVYFETPANPTMACVDMEALATLAHEYGAVAVADNTFCTPYLQQPLKFGVDYVIHSTTKFLNGHGNSVAGAIVSPHMDTMRDVVWKALKLIGTNCNAWDAWLINNGLKTLEVRMDRHCSNAMEIARFLDQHPAVERVNYTGLPGHPDHQLASRQMTQHGGMLSFELAGGLEAGKQFMNKLQLCTMAPTLGDVDTLILHPASMSHAFIPKAIRLENGITDGLIRISVGIENVGDIVADLEQSLL